MPGLEDDVPTVRELYRIMCDFRDEWRTKSEQLVRKDVHNVEHETLVARILVLEATVQRQDEDLRRMAEKRVLDLEAARNQLQSRTWALVTTVLGGIILTALIAWAG